jgi:uncharacterized repeat protein (TIGR03943 family)
MQSKVSNVINALTLIGLGAVFLSFYWTGRIEQYLNPLFRPLVLAGGVLTVVVGVTRLLTRRSAHCCSEAGCDHRHASSLLGRLASFGVICVTVLAGSIFSKDAFDQQIFVNRGSVEDDSRLSGAYAANAGLSEKPGAGGVRSLPGSTDHNIAVEVTDLLRAKTVEPLRNSIAGKNVAVVGQFVPGSTEKSFRLTRMFIWCCAADARAIHVNVEASDPVHVSDLQWVKVIGKPEYLISDDGRMHLFVRADSVEPIKAPKDAMLY